MDVCWDMTKERPKKPWLYALVFLAVLLGGCADMDMSGFGYLGCAMQAYPTPAPKTSTQPVQEEKAVTQIAQCQHQPTCPTP